MKNFTRSTVLTTSCSLAILSFSTTAQAVTTVDTELVLLLDGSGSISSTDFGLQLDAYKNAFTDPNFFNTFVAPLSTQKIALSALQFGSAVTEIAPFTLIDSQAAATAFGNLFMGVTQDQGLTNMGQAIIDGTTALNTNDFDGFKTIDISTDGVPTTGPDATQASLDAIGAGVNVINAIAVGFGSDVTFLQNNITRGTNKDGSAAFVLTADSFTEFEASLQEKLAAEIIAPPPRTTPEPSSLISLIGLGVFSAGSMLKSKRK